MPESDTDDIDTLWEDLSRSLRDPVFTRWISRDPVVRNELFQMLDDESKDDESDYIRK